MAAASDDHPGSSSTSEFTNGDDVHTDAAQFSEVPCLVHNFPDDNNDDMESTIRSLLEPDVLVRHCRLSDTGLYDVISVTSSTTGPLVRLY